MSRYIIVTWHGEGRTLFYLVDAVQEIVLETFRSREDAEHYKQWINNPLKHGANDANCDL